MLEAKDLVKADIAVLGKGKSDPYAVIKGKLITIAVNQTNLFLRAIYFSDF